MYSSEKMQEVISYVLLIGTILSASLVIIGGAMYLLHYGGDNMQIEVLRAEAFHTSISNIVKIGFSFSAEGVIILGLLLLITTQILRVALLSGFYALMRDYWFAWICFFITVILIYSLFWRI